MKYQEEKKSLTYCHGSMVIIMCVLYNYKFKFFPTFHVVSGTVTSMFITIFNSIADRNIETE